MQRTRLGVYGVALKEGKILLVEQEGGPYKGKFDFPGGGNEFGETIEEALRREFAEEVACGFESMSWIANLTAVVLVQEAYTFYQIGLIYQVHGLHSLDGEGHLKHAWVDLRELNENNCSALLIQYLNQGTK